MITTILLFLRRLLFLLIDRIYLWRSKYRVNTGKQYKSFRVIKTRTEDNIQEKTNVEKTNTETKENIEIEQVSTENIETKED